MSRVYILFLANFEVKLTSAKQFGNSVVPVVEEIAKSIIE